MKITDFKIVIKAKKVPVNVNNEIIDYVQDSSRPNDHLYCEVFFQNNLISQGIILDYYNKFEILEDFEQKRSTHVLRFEWKGAEYPQHTSFGDIVSKLKYFKKPPLEEIKRDSYLNEIVSYLNGYILPLKRNHNNLTLTFIPSSSKISDEIAYRLSEINTIPLQPIIAKKSAISSKSMTTLEEQSFNKYHLNLNHLKSDDRFILLDDVMGTGASICETMAKLYGFTQKINYFFIVVKDVKR